MKYFNTGYYRDFQLAGDERRVHYDLLIAAPTKKAAMEATGMGVSYWKDYVSEEHHPETIAEMDTFPPCTPLVRRDAFARGTENPLVPLDDAWSQTTARQEEEQATQKEARP